MNCARTRFLLYAYLEREISGPEADALSRHLQTCRPCAARARSARGLASVLRSHVERASAPSRLRERIRQGEPVAARFRYPLLATAAVILLLLIPLVADVSGPLSPPLSGGQAAASAGFVQLSNRAPASAESGLVSRSMSGTLVCLDCEARVEAGLCPLPKSHHEAAICADNGEVWRLMPRDPAFSQKTAGQTVTVEGVGFSQSGFLRASRVGY
ncbi:MAG: zf-HC2 domain-containing protein [Acidobacteriota bacterium]